MKLVSILLSLMLLCSVAYAGTLSMTYDDLVEDRVIDALSWYFSCDPNETATTAEKKTCIEAKYKAIALEIVKDYESKDDRLTDYQAKRATTESEITLT